MYRHFSCGIGLLLYVYFIPSIWCLNNETITWPEKQSSVRFTGMLLSKYEGHIIVSGTNVVYNINASNLELLNSDATGPYNASTDDIVKLMIYNQTFSGPEYVTTCSNSQNYCSIRKLDDLTDVEWQLQKPVRDITGVQAFLVDSVHGSKHDSYLFVGCPHGKDQDMLEGLCKKPGIFWYKNSGDEENDKVSTQAFKTDTDVKTKKFIAAFAVEKMRIFFSIQSQVNGPLISRVAQVCQYYDDVLGGYTTPYTYVDMPIQCGEFREVFDVKKVSVDNTTLLIAVFTDNDSKNTAICVYNMTMVNETFVDNMEICYHKEVKPVPSEYYFRYGLKDPPCGSIWKGDPPTDEDYLCNTQNQQTMHHMIGSIPLVQDPVIQVNEVVTSVTAATEHSAIITYLGIANGTVLKAMVFPTAQMTNQPVPSTYDSAIIQMHTSHDQGHLFVLTQHKVYKTPAESCSSFMTSDECIASKDPYCGWCMLANRCSRSSMCENTYSWIPATSTHQGPSILEIQPNMISERKLNELKIKVSHNILLSTVSCVFGNEFMRLHTVEASVSGGGSTITCKPEFTAEERESIQGALNVSVAIVTPISSSPILTGYFSVYNCNTFYSCGQCTDMKYSCVWNKQLVMCNYNSSHSTDLMYVDRQEMCPRAESYEIRVSHDMELVDPNKRNGLSYLSKDEDYKIVMNGANLPEVSQFGFSCRISLGSTHIIWINNTAVPPNKVECHITKDDYQVLGYHGELNATIQFMYGSSEIEGEPLKAVVYECESLSEASENCGLCQSFATSQPHYHCKWCESSCIYNQNFCNETDIQCPDPEITNVYPLSVAVSATVQVVIEGKNLGSVFEDTIDAVTVAGKICQSIQELYMPGKKIVCQLEPSNKPIDGKVKLALATNASGEYSEPFSFRVPVIKYIEPEVGPYDGGTMITLFGDFLNTGINRTVYIGGKHCKVNDEIEEIKGLRESRIDVQRRLVRGKNKRLYMVLTPRKQVASLMCKTQAWDVTEANTTANVSVDFDGAIVNGGENVSFAYVTNPSITNISPLKSFASGGRGLTVKGKNLYAIQRPRIYAMINEKSSKREDCQTISSDEIYCPSPRYEGGDLSGGDNRVKRSPVHQGSARLGFIMDDVASVQADNLPEDIAGIIYFPDPVIYNQTRTKELKEIQDDNLVIKGSGLDLAASREDVTVMIGCMMCNITDFTTETILCKPATGLPTCNSPAETTLKIQVSIGYYKRNVGEVTYKPIDMVDKGDSIVTYVVISVIVMLVLFLVIAGVVVFRMMKKKKLLEKEVSIKMDKLEANFRNQCREEFANLQTAVSDLTGDLAGGQALFREYSMYADKTLFTSHKSEPLRHPPSISSEQTEKAMETFKGLLLNTQFLSMFIKTLEKQKSFTIHDKSNVATILMVLNHDNMEYITANLASLLNDLVDKNIASGTPKLLLRRSESVAEKLLTHWLSICMYHDLNGKTGSALYILYKAIKIQTEKGPIDYITNCGKYTLSEDKLFTFGDRDITPVTLGLQVKHSSCIDDQEQQIKVNVLDCDTITQAKSKILDIFYKNVPYSQRPSVHSTTLEVEEESGGTKRLLNDEDASSVKDGLWKRINTLLHYKIQDAATVILSFNLEMERSCKTLIGVASPDSYIVGSFRKSRPAVRTISGSNFWHLTKKHQVDEEAPQASDLFLSRLTTTKMTLQPYIDDLYTTLFTVDDEPSIIIKYLFDFLDMAASRCGVTDPDVVHTWKCNSLLLRFWVNIIKNPEFVFDVHKPLLVDSCLSVVAQTLMDSCSTADLLVNKNSPSNKLLFAKDIPRYKQMVKNYFQTMKEKPAVSDQDLNSYLTQKVSQKFSGNFHTQSGLNEIFKYAVNYKNELCAEMDNLEASSPGSFSPLTSKLQYIFMCMETK